MDKKLPLAWTERFNFHRARLAGFDVCVSWEAQGKGTEPAGYKLQFGPWIAKQRYETAAGAKSALVPFARKVLTAALASLDNVSPG